MIRCRFVEYRNLGRSGLQPSEIGLGSWLTLGSRVDAAATREIDLHQCHRPDPVTPIEETVCACEDPIPQGKVLHWGVSQWRAEHSVDAYLAPEAIAKGDRLKPLAAELRISLPQLALAWCLRQPSVASAIVGVTKISQLEEDVAARRKRVDWRGGDGSDQASSPF